jgi:acetyl-CoA carboxylase biotin carboxyl carrier protein
MPKKDSKDKAPPRALKVVGAPPAGRARAGQPEAAGQPEGSSGIDFESVRVLARIATEFDLEEIELNGAGHLRVRRGVRDGGVTSLLGPAAARPIALTPPVASASEVDGIFVTSPFVGTFYRAASPETPPFVDNGQPVRKGQVVCIVEAMKLMNEIEAEAEGRVEEILVKNGEHVEYGQRLIRLSKS